MLAAPMAASASASFARNPDIGGLGRGVETAWASSCGATRRADEKPAQLGFFAVRILSELDLLNCPIVGPKIDGHGTRSQAARHCHCQPGPGPGAT